MNQEKVTKLLKDPEFVKELLKVDTEEQASKLFASHGCPVEPEDIELIAQSVALVIKKEGKISDEDLSAVAGGGAEEVLARVTKGGLFEVIGAAVGGSVGLYLPGRVTGDQLVSCYISETEGRTKASVESGLRSVGRGLGIAVGSAAGAAIGHLIGRRILCDPKKSNT